MCLLQRSCYLVVNRLFPLPSNYSLYTSHSICGTCWDFIIHPSLHTQEILITLNMKVSAADFTLNSISHSSFKPKRTLELWIWFQFWLLYSWDGLLESIKFHLNLLRSARQTNLTIKMKKFYFFYPPQWRFAKFSFRFRCIHFHRRRQQIDWRQAFMCMKVSYNFPIDTRR